MEDENIYFEIKDLGNFIRIQPIDIRPNRDDNWIMTKITLKAGGFSGEYDAEMMTYTFKDFYKQFSKLYDNLQGYVSFNDIERNLEMKISGDGIGHFNVEVSASDRLASDSNLNFTLSFDQTQIKGMADQLEKVNKFFFNGIIDRITGFFY